MLVLSRKKNESIVVDDNIVITVIEIRGDKVRLGIQAPKEMSIARSEITVVRKEQNPNPDDNMNDNACPPSSHTDIN